MQESVHFYTKVYAYRHPGPPILEKRNHSGDTGLPESAPVGCLRHRPASPPGGYWAWLRVRDAEPPSKT